LEKKAMNEIEKTQQTALQQTAFSTADSFDAAQRMARLLSESELVPKAYQKSIPNCVIALEMSQRLGMNPLMVMQNLAMIQGKPSWSSQFLIACINGCGKFSPLRYEFTGREGGDDRACVAIAYDKATGEKLSGPPASIRIAKAEGWFDRNGSKWKTMPELMLRYRAAAFFQRTFCPELAMGMHTHEEIIDVGEVKVVDDPLSPGRHEMRKKPAPTVAAETIQAEPGDTAKLPDACGGYQIIAKYASEKPDALNAAIESARAKYPECEKIETWRDIDHADVNLCGQILGEMK
jgi:hypothetical protein